MAYSQKLAAHAKQLGHDVRIALVGAGQMGRGFGNQVHRMSGLSVRLVIDIDTNRITELFKDLGVTDVVISNDHKEIERALNEGKSAGTTTTEFLSDLTAIDFIVECTGVPDTFDDEIDRC